MLDQSKKFYMNIDMYIKDLFQTHTSMSILKLYMYSRVGTIFIFWDIKDHIHPLMKHGLKG